MGAVRADDTPSLDLPQAPAGDRAFLMERARVHGHWKPSARLVLSHARAPLTSRTRQDEADPAVLTETVLHALAALPMHHMFVLHLDLPFVLTESAGARPDGRTTLPDPSGAGLADVRVGGRLRLFGSPEDEPDKLDGALALAFVLPTATSDYGGDHAVRARLAALLEATTPRLHGGAGLGVETRPAETLDGLLPLRTGTAGFIALSGGFFLDAQGDIEVGLEGLAETTLAGGAKLLDPRASRVHLLATASGRINGGPLEVGFALGPGFAEGPGAADYRVLVLAGYAEDEPEPPPDGDEDRIPDKADACPRLPGMGSADPLLHGCPEAPPDQDGDAIPDPQDACPDVAGRPTGMRRTHGCPPPRDSDGDGLFDHEDACPEVAGPAPPKGDGCPPPKPRAALVERRIELDQQVLFETGTAVIQAESDGLLGEIATVLREHPELLRVEVQGHTDETGHEADNRVLAQRRAEAVVSWLVAHGIDGARLVSKGYGADRPIADNTTEEGRQRNRRVELHVLDVTPGSTP